MYIERVSYPFGESDYQRGYRDGQEARKRDDARREYERGYRDGYGSTPHPWGSLPFIYRDEYKITYSDQDEYIGW